MTAVLRYEAARRALADARAVDEVKDIRDKAVAMQVYARQAKDTELIKHATAIRFRAERRLGEMMAEQPKAPPGRKPDIGLSKNPISERNVDRPVELTEAGIDKNLADRARKAAAMSEEQFERKISEAQRAAASAIDRVATTEEKRERRDEREAELGAKITSGNLTLPDHQYGIILADWPRKPWAYSDETGVDRSPANHYPVQSFDWAIDVLAPMIRKIAAPDCMLAFWSTAASLVDDLEIMAEAGFIAFRRRDGNGKLLRASDGQFFTFSESGTYRSHQVWDKQAIGLGRWFRDRHELLLIGVRGNFPAPAPGTQSYSIFSEKRGEHSAKPDFIAAEIERLWPTTPKIEMFARRAREGWEAWGLDAPSLPQNLEAAE
jgi:N6-adenosine-specific RNA methylase IME4